MQALILAALCLIYRLYFQDVLRLMYTLGHKKGIHLKFQCGISLRFRETFKEKPQRDNQRSREHPVLSPTLFLSSPPACSLYISNTRILDALPVGQLLIFLLY